jgi:hypothetical protein
MERLPNMKGGTAPESRGEAKENRSKLLELDPKGLKWYLFCSIIMIPFNFPWFAL